jgi:hypothetical protein
MITDQDRYVRRETLIGIAINAVLSALFTILVFGGTAVAAVGAIAQDAFPQSFMIALMTALVPTAITRKRLRGGQIAPLPASGSGLPRNLVLRGLLVAVAAALIGGGLHWVLLPLLAPPLWSFPALLAYKVAYGGLLAASIGPWLISSALADGAPRSVPDIGG